MGCVVLGLPFLPRNKGHVWFLFFSVLFFLGAEKAMIGFLLLLLLFFFSFWAAVTEFLQKDKLMIFFPVSFVELAFQGVLLFIKAPLSLRTDRNGHEDLNGALSALHGRNAPLRLTMNA
ncbi:hypothetical protein AVEN_259140-1 [Araneus ventricosus]|uniref:Uncharacterized protein n=1 Tax=Araneus ventricosus TaxID=182803 RepID=A0A4Y2JPH1_ARAVE|nr:hypothetical protein AVEN_259140-1 [Araneus ventricosus]